MNHSQDPEDLEGIAIIGMSGRFPGAKNVDQFWQNLVAEVDSITRYNADELEFSVLTPEAIARGAKSVSARGVLDDVEMFDAAFFGIYPKEAEVMDPQHRIFLECAWESLESAGYDSQTYPGMIGVYAGTSLNTYLLNNLCGASGFASKLAGNYQISEYQTMMGNDKDFLPTRVSYKLNLRGPSMAIQTACSTSLVAISQACSSLLNYQCDMALSGGVSITFPQRRDYLYQEEGMASVDGTCRTFDADAKGTVFGHGSAVVLLKRLSDAWADGDNILAVIKGSAINNDGSDKIGYAAPSVTAQAEVIAMAQAAADVTPDSISYIEAHGTGTPLGDPIEIAALTQAFREGGATGNGYCAIGTGKPNISHLDVAAGATGLIKTVLQFQHGQIPPLLHFKSPNPKIDFDNSPFYPVKELTPWQRGDQPRRAGISAFGVGGTNAHVVMEEAPIRAPQPDTADHHVFPLSAKTETALHSMRENLAAKIDSSPELNLADIAYTLQIGRTPFDHRTAVVASNRDKLIAGLNTDLKKSITGNSSSKKSRGEPGVVFMFPGQGAQHVDMGRDLYEKEPVFRREVDRCAEILEQHLGQDVRTVLYPGDDDTARAESEQRINETSMTQPAIFVVEYALARLWMSWGVKPAAMIGHSIGEYVCAVLAETFRLEDALELLAVRARLMQELPGGSMLGVRLSAKEVKPMLPSGASIAAMNSPKLCTVSGPTKILEAFLVGLENKGHTGRMLATSHAFHSSMMDPMLEQFTQASARAIEKTANREPKIHWISSCTGKQMTAVDTGDASYWSRQIRQPVRFAEALDKLLENSDDYVFIEVGPGRALNQFAKQHPAKLPIGRILVSIGQPETDDADRPSTLTALAKLWAAGVIPDWDTLHADQRRLRVPLPTYPFERKRFWVDPPNVENNGHFALPSVNNSAANVASSLRERSVGDNCIANDCQTAAPLASDLTDLSNLSDQSDPSAESTPAIPINQPSAKERIAQELRTIILNLSGMEVEDADATFMDLGFDSLFLSQASQGINSRFKIKITFRQLLGDLSCVASIAEFLEPQLPDEMLNELLGGVDAQPVASPNEPLSGIDIQSIGLPAALTSGQLQNPSDVHRLLAGHLQSIQQLLQQSERQLAAGSPAGHAGNSGNSLRVVRKPASSASSDTTGSTEAKRFGPYKPIEKGEQGGLTPVQEDALRRLTERYLKRTLKSKEYTAEHRPHFADPRAVSGFKSQWKELIYPIVSARSKGSKIWDIDGNEYIDITMGFGTYFFGHSPDWLTDAIEKQLRTGIEIGPQSPLAGKVAKMISEFTGLDRVTFCNTGSEAVMAAMRLARTVTGRNRIVYFSGDYHGMFEEVLVRGAWPKGEYRAQPIAPGIPPSLAENILVLEYGTEESLEIIKNHGDEIAAVMVEPVQSRNPSFQPREFLHQVRALTQDIGAALIFDEVVTGFRCHSGGAQAYFDVKADMATYGKVVGGGIPIGVLAGSAKYMDALDGGMWEYGDDSFPEVGVTFFAGTFVRHPLAIAAAYAVLKFLKEAGPDLQLNMTRRVTNVCETINQHMVEAQVPIRMSSFSAFAAIDYASDLKYASLLWYYMREKGIHIWEGRPCYFTIAHTDEDLQKFIDAFCQSVTQMQEDGFLPQRGATDLANGNKAVSGNVVTDFCSGIRQNSPASKGAMGSLATSATSRGFPLAEGQREMWLGAQMSPDAAGPHHACNAFVVDGEFDVEAMQKAFAMVVDRHEGLRCTFNSDGTEVLIQPDFALDVPLIDLSSLSVAEEKGLDAPQSNDAEKIEQQNMESEATRFGGSLNLPDCEKRVQEIMEAEGRRLFDLTQGPLIAAQILKLSETKHQIVVTAQMIACDGWSHYVLFEELSEIYSAIREGREPNLKEAIPMRNYAQWQNEYWTTSEAKACEEYWLSQYKTVPAPLELPTKGRRPLSRSVAAKRTDVFLPTEFYEEIKRFGRAKKSSSFAVLLAAFQVWLHRLSGANDLVVGVPFSAQNPLGFDTLVGQCANTLPLRAQFHDDENFQALLSRTWDSLLDAQENAHYTFGRLIPHLDIQQDPSRIPLVSVIFNIDPAMTKVKFSGLKHDFFAGPRFYYQFDLGFNLVEEENGLRVECDYNANMFDGEVVQQWLSGYESLLRNIVADQDQSISMLPMMDHPDYLEDARQIDSKMDFASTVDFDSTTTGHQMVTTQIKRAPESTAVQELLLPLSVGGQTLVVSPSLANDPRLLNEKIAEAGVTMIQATPTTLRRLLSSGWQGAPNLKILVGGEPISRDLADRLLPCCDQLWHGYETTENANWIAAKQLLPESTVTLGKPIVGVTMSVVDDRLQPVPVGVPGELIVDGVFRTGDRVKRLVNGELEFIGDQNSLVMVHGHDVNLADVESVLREHAQVDDVAVILRDDLPGEPALVAYGFVGKEKLAGTDTKVLTRELRQLVRDQFPKHSRPACFVYSSSVPMTSDGKLDRSNLPAPPENWAELNDEADDYVAPSTSTQEALVSIWQDVLKNPKIGVNDNFFELGGQSLLAVTLFARIESDLGRKLPLAMLFRAPTITQLSALLDDNVTDGNRGWPSLIPIQPQGSKTPLFLVHGAGGNVLLYQTMIQYFAPEYPLYGLQSQGLDGESEPLQSIEDMAQRYLQEIRAVQPQGPYYLGGYCLGGTVAYEMAQQLERDGEKVAIVAMLDTYNFSRALKSSMLGFLFQKLRFHLGNLLGLRPRHMIEYFKEKFRVARNGEFSNLFTSRPSYDVEAGRATAGAELNVQKINDNAAEVYIPQPYAGTLTLLKPRINYKFYPDPKMGWGDLAENLDIVEFPFNPHAMLVEPYVQQLADQLIEKMNADSA